MSSLQREHSLHHCLPKPIALMQILYIGVRSNFSRTTLSLAGSNRLELSVKYSNPESGTRTDWKTASQSWLYAASLSTSSFASFSLNGGGMDMKRLAGALTVTPSVVTQFDGEIGRFAFFLLGFLLFFFLFLGFFLVFIVVFFLSGQRYVFVQWRDRKFKRRICRQMPIRGGARRQCERISCGRSVLGAIPAKKDAVVAAIAVAIREFCLRSRWKDSRPRCGRQARSSL